MTARISQQHPPSGAPPIPLGAPVNPTSSARSALGYAPTPPGGPAPARMVTLPLPSRTPALELDALPSPSCSTGSPAVSNLPSPTSRMVSLPVQPSSALAEASNQHLAAEINKIRRQVALELQRAGWEEVLPDSIEAPPGHERKAPLEHCPDGFFQQQQANSPKRALSQPGAVIRQTTPGPSPQSRAGSGKWPVGSMNSVEVSPKSVPKVIAPTLSWGSQDSIRCEERHQDSSAAIGGSAGSGRGDSQGTRIKDVIPPTPAVQAVVITTSDTLPGSQSVGTSAARTIRSASGVAPSTVSTAATRSVQSVGSTPARSFGAPSTAGTPVRSITAPSAAATQSFGAATSSVNGRSFGSSATASASASVGITPTSSQAPLLLPNSGNSVKSIPGSGSFQPSERNPEPRPSPFRQYSVGSERTPLWSPTAPQRMISSPVTSFQQAVSTLPVTATTVPSTPVPSTPLQGLRTPVQPQTPAQANTPAQIITPKQGFRQVMTPVQAVAQDPASSPPASSPLNPIRSASLTVCVGPPTASFRQVAPPIRAAPLVVSPRSSPLHSTRNSAISNVGLRSSLSEWSSLGTDTQPLGSPASSPLAASSQLAAMVALADQEVAAAERAPFLRMEQFASSAGTVQPPSTPAESEYSPTSRSLRSTRRHAEVGIRSSLKAHCQKQFSWDNVEEPGEALQSGNISRGSPSEPGVSADVFIENGHSSLAYPVGTSSVSTATGRFTSSTRTTTSIEDDARLLPGEAHQILAATVCADKKLEDSRQQPPSPSNKSRKGQEPETPKSNRAVEDIQSLEGELRYGSQAEVERVFILTLRQEHKSIRRGNSRHGTIERSRSNASSSGSPRHSVSGSRSRAKRQSSAGQGSLRGRAESRDSFSPSGSVGSNKSKPNSFRGKANQ